MILKKQPRVALPDYPMRHKRRLCDTSIMTEYHAIQPYFINSTEDLMSVSPHCACPNDDMWKKFELLPTPPRSPRHSRDSDSQTTKQSATEPDATLTSDREIFDALNDLDLIMDATEFESVDEEPMNETACHDKSSCECCEQKLIKDCMWNGVGHRSSVEKFKNGRNRKSSPELSRSPCHANGCVDPRNIFPFPVGQPSCCDTQKRRCDSNQAIATKRHRPVDGAETPSDSEEEIDVVTVEAKQQIFNVLKSKNGPGKRVSIGPKMPGTLIPKGSGDLKLLTAGATNYGTTKEVKNVTDRKKLDMDRGRPRSKQIHVLSAINGQPKNVQARTVAMVIERRGDMTSGKDSQQVKFQVGVPVVASEVSKRRQTTDDCCSKDQNMQGHLMRLANPKAVMKGSDSVSPDSRVAGKKRFLSLDGISFCPTNGAHKYNKEYNRQKDLPKFPTFSLTPNGTLKAAQEAAITVTGIRNKTKSKPMFLTSVKKEECDGIQSSLLASPPNKRKRKTEPLNSGSGSGSGSDSEQIRAAHNVLERQRREGLRASFHELRDNVPDLRKMERTPKVNILNKARDYCLEITETERSLISEKERQMKKQQKLMRRLQMLKEKLNIVEHVESEIESDVEEKTSAVADSPPKPTPAPSKPPTATSKPPTTHLFAAQASQNGYIIARRVSTDQNQPGAQQEVLLRLEACENNTTTGSPASQGKRFILTSPEYPIQPAKQQRFGSNGVHMMLANLQQKKSDTNLRILSFQNSEALSDGYEENYESEEDALVSLNQGGFQMAY